MRPLFSMALKVFMARGMPRRFGTLLTLALVAVSAPASGATLVGTPANYKEMVNQLKPGDVLVLEAGTYTQGLNLSNLHGQSGQPIIISGPESGEPAVFVARSCCNTVQLDDSSFVTIRNVTLDGQGTSGVDGVNASGVTHHITIEGLLIINHNDHQQTVGISTKGPAWDWIIRNNTIIGAGTGMYFGNSSGGYPFVRGLIEHNLVLNTIGYNMEIKHQNPRPTDIGMPTGNSKTIIRHNVFSKAENASFGDSARPNVLVGHFPTSGSGVDDLYEIYGNFFYQNPSEVLFQGEGNVALYDNVFVNDGGSAVTIQPHNDVPRSITIFHNTVVANGHGIKVRGGAAGYSQSVVANAVFAESPVEAPDIRDNITDTYTNANQYLLAPAQSPGAGLDLYPRPGKLQGEPVDLTPFSGLTDGQRDFNGDSRTGAFRGAYAGEGTNLGWPLALTHKTGGSSGATQPPPVSEKTPPLAPQLGNTNLSLIGELNEPFFSDPDEGDTHSASQWEIALDQEFTQMVFHGLRTKDRLDTPLTLAPGILEPNHTYWVRVRQQDSSGLWSNWALPVSMITPNENPNDLDHNGTDDRYQVSLDDGVDTDANGIVDLTEGMCNLRDAEQGNFIGLMSDEGVLSCLTSLASNEIPTNSLSGRHLPHGLLAFRITNITPGNSVRLKVHMPIDIPPDAVWGKYNPLTGELSPYSDATIQSNTIELILTDGGNGDDDGVANGSIVDPSGLILSASTNTSNVQPSSGGGGSFSLPMLFFILLGAFVRLARIPA